MPVFGGIGVYRIDGVASEIGAIPVESVVSAITGNSSQTEPAETGSASGTVGSTGINGSSSQTEPDETGSAAGTVLVSGTSSQTDPSETGSAAGTVLVSGSSTQTEPAETGTASGTVGSTGINGSSSQTEPDETGSAAGVVLVSGASTQTEPAETGTASGTVLVSGSSIKTEPAETGTAAGTVGFTGVTGDSTRTEPSETGSASGSLLIAGVSVQSEPAETGVANGTAVQPPSGFVRRRDERILNPRYLSRVGDTGATWTAALRGRRRLATFVNGVITAEAVFAGRPGQQVFSSCTCTGGGTSVYRPGVSTLPDPIANPSAVRLRISNAPYTGASSEGGVTPANVNGVWLLPRTATDYFRLETNLGEGAYWQTYPHIVLDTDPGSDVGIRFSVTTTLNGSWSVQDAGEIRQIGVLCGNIPPVDVEPTVPPFYVAPGYGTVEILEWIP